MIKDLYQKICRGEERRANLISLRRELKNENNQKILLNIAGNNLDEIMKCLVDTDAKVRKNAALILGEMHWQEALEVLFDAYEEEEQRFLKADYVKAMSGLDCTSCLQEFHKRLEELLACEPAENEKKHVQAEIQELQALILQEEGIKKHTFCGYERANEVIFVTLPVFRDALAAQFGGKKTLLKTGVRTVVTDMEEALKVRLYSEMLFVLDCGKQVPAEPRAVAEELQSSNLLQILEENHKEAGPFYFRIGISGAMPLKERSTFAKKTAAAVEEAFGRRLINSASRYEIEIRLIQNAQGSIYPCLKCHTLPDHRFDYRRYHVAAGMRPYLAAGLMELARPYLREHAQVLDPFCGVGTLLIERRFLLSVRNAYGIDTFGEAVEKARANSKIAGMQMNYINRDYFDFVHEYAFDEIVTDMPSGNLSKQELDTLYRKFFEKSAEVLTDKGRIICYSKEMGLIKKQLRIQNTFKLLQEYCIQEKTGAYLFILEKK